MNVRPRRRGSPAADATRSTAAARGCRLLGIARDRPARAIAERRPPGWPEDAFKQKTEADALRAAVWQDLRGVRQSHARRARDRRKRRRGAGFGHARPAGVTSICILVPENPFTLAASYKLRRRHPAVDRLPAENGEDQRRGRHRRIRRQTVRDVEASQSHARRLRRLSRQEISHHGIDHPRSRQLPAAPRPTCSR